MVSSRSGPEFKLLCDVFSLNSTGSTYRQKEEGTTVDDRSANIPTSGTTITLYYNIVSSGWGSSSGGHIIENTDGTDLPQENNLQFVGAYTEDDSANDRTKVNVVRTMTKAQMDALSAAEKVGFIRTSDEADNPYQGSHQAHRTSSCIPYGVRISVNTDL